MSVSRVNLEIEGFFVVSPDTGMVVLSTANLTYRNTFTILNRKESKALRKALKRAEREARNE